MNEDSLVNKDILKVKDLKKTYDEKNYVLNGVNLDIKEGEFISIMGPSGSGKSTLLYSISSLDEVREGKIEILDKDISKLSEDEICEFRRNKMGFVFQDASFINNLTILDNILLPTMEDKDKSKYDKKSLEIMEKLNIKDLKDRNIKEVSGGQLQRASIARALINDPRILFLDEPTGALNSKTTNEILKIFKNLNEEGLTIILVTHDPLVASISKRVIYLKDGNVVEDLNLSDVKEELRLDKVKFIMDKLSI